MTDIAPPIPGKTHDQWVLDVMPQVEQAQKVIEDGLSRDPAQLCAQASVIEDTYREVTSILAQAEAWLDWFEYVAIMKIDRDLTVPERNIILKVKVSPHRMLRDKIKGLSESLKSRMRRAQWQA